MADEAAPKKRRKVALEAGVGIAVVLVCLGAYFGPKLYRSIKLAGLIRELRAAEGDLDKAALSLHRIIGMECTAADAFLAGYADESDMRAWMPERRAFFAASSPEVKELTELAADKDKLARILCVKGGDQAGDEVDARCSPYIAIEAIRSGGGHLEIQFRLSGEASRAWGVPESKAWTLRLEGKKAVKLDGIFYWRTEYCVWRTQGVMISDAFIPEAPFGLAEHWLKRVGAGSVK